MPVLRGKSSPEQVTLQSSQEAITMATQGTLEQRNLRRGSRSQQGRGRYRAYSLFWRGELEHLCGKLVTCPCCQPEDTGTEA